MRPLIAIVEDDPDQRRNYLDALRARAYQVVGYSDRAQAQAGMRQSPPDLVILDVMLGDEVNAGFELCRELLNQRPDLPVLFLTSRTDEIDQVFGLRLGAWDYQTKPVSLTLLAERVAALLNIARQRSRVQSATETPTLGALKLDPHRVQVSWHGTAVPLTVTECALLARVVEKPGGVASYDELAKATRQTLVTNNTVNTHIRHIRRKFKAVDPGFQHLENVYGAGYRWKTGGDSV